MSETCQKWTVKKAQDLRPGDLISGWSGNFALEVTSVEVDSDRVLVKRFSDLYRLCIATYEMQMDQLVPVALSGVKHMDIITNHFLTSEDLYEDR